MAKDTAGKGSREETQDGAAGQGKKARQNAGKRIWKAKHSRAGQSAGQCCEEGEHARRGAEGRTVLRGRAAW